MQAKFDLALWELMVAARENDEAALNNQTIWTLAEARPKDVCCLNSVDAVMVARVLCREAQLRGLAPPGVGATCSV